MFDEEDYYDYCESLDDYDKVREVITNLVGILKETSFKELNETVERLQEENKALATFRDEKDKYDAKIEALEQEIQRIKSSARDEARKERFQNLIGSMQETAWCVKMVPTYVHDKCDKCDENRKIHFFSPNRVEHTEECSCAKRKYVYSPEECNLLKFSVDNFGVRKAMYAKKRYADGDEYDVINGQPYLMYSGQPFPELNKNTTYYYYFKNKEDCEKFCEYLNETRGNTGEG